MSLVLVGRSSSHFTRTARVFALELGIAHEFRPVFDMTSTDVAAYSGNPALKVPTLVDDITGGNTRAEDGALFGTDNICRALAKRSPMRSKVVLRGDVDARVVANVEEMTLHAMSTEVSIIMTKMMKDAPPPPKLRPSLENALAHLEDNIDRALERLPGDRVLSFLEVSLYCLVTHLPFRQVMDVAPYEKLAAFVARFGQRESAKQTGYRFDAA